MNVGAVQAQCTIVHNDWMNDVKFCMCLYNMYGFREKQVEYDSKKSCANRLNEAHVAVFIRICNAVSKLMGHLCCIHGYMVNTHMNKEINISDSLSFFCLCTFQVAVICIEYFDIDSDIPCPVNKFSRCKSELK